MPWGKGGRVPRLKLEELDAVTHPVPLLKDVWVKSKLILTHIAGLSSLVSTMVTEATQTRASLDRLTDEVRRSREVDAKTSDDLARVGIMSGHFDDTVRARARAMDWAHDEVPF